MIKLIYQRIPFLQTIRIKHYQEQSKKVQINQRRVLSGYRFLLKQIPVIYERPLKRASMYAELKYIFHQSTIIYTKQQQQARIQHMQKIIQEIKQKDYTSLGSFIINQNAEPQELKMFVNRNQGLLSADMTRFFKRFSR